MGLWERYVVPPLVSCACSTKPFMKQREKVVPLATGRVLEVGCGSGANFSYYNGDRVDELIALEPSAGMIARAKKAADEAAIGASVTFVEAGAEQSGLEDNSIDTAVVTFVLCTIPDWRAALTEIRRVLKPDGSILFSEHGLAPDEGVAKWQKRVEPIWKPLVGGCHLTRDTGAMLKESGFTVSDHQTMYLPSTPKIAGFVSWGAAGLA